MEFVKSVKISECEYVSDQEYDQTDCWTMTKKIATPKQTSGGGFSFEDKVVGYFLTWMLAGTAPFKIPGIVNRLDCQVGVDDWEEFDDLLITIDGKETQHRYAFSLKSNIQITKSRVPAPLVESAWNLILHRHSEVMNIDHDKFGLVCVPHPEPQRAAIHSLLFKASDQTPEQLSERLPRRGYASNTERELHESCTCPDSHRSELQKEEALAGNILKRMTFLELDFESSESICEATVLFICSGLVADGTNTAALNLWNALCQIAKRVRNHGCGIARNELHSEIRSILSLRDLPDFAMDWTRLEEWRDTALSSVPDRIAGKAKVDRSDITAKVMTSFEESRFVGLIGASGTGKTVVAKYIAERASKSGSVLWFRGNQFRDGFIHAFGNNHQLQNSLKKVLGKSKFASGLVVLDAGERLLEEADFKEFTLLLNMLEMEQKGSVWRVLISCREEAWDQVQLSLMGTFGNTINWKPVRVDYPTFKTLSPVWETFPELRALAVRPHLSQVMRNLKVIDLLASAISTGHKLDARSWVGESELIMWYWDQVVRSGSDGARRSSLLQKFAEENADTGHFEKPETDFTTDELKIIGAASDLLVTDTRKSVVFFAHDLISDWARFHALNSHEHKLAEYCEHRFSNPRWHTALRLYGIFLLEEDKTGSKWQTAINSYPEAQYSFLESLVFAGNSLSLLHNAWSFLVAEDGKLLNAFLKRFQYVASIPNPDFVNLASPMTVSLDEAQTWDRVPLWMYWLGIINALVDHVDDLIVLAPFETAKLAASWLRHTPQDWPGRQSAAKLAIAIAQKSIRADRFHHRSESNGQLPFKALLEAYPDCPEEIGELLLKAAARQIPSEDDGNSFKNYEAPGTVTYLKSTFSGVQKRIVQTPWPDGPLYRPDSAFRAACFDTDALRPVMTHAPDLASEIILALLIEQRPPLIDPDYSHDKLFSKDSVCLENDLGFFPRFYTRGPFLLFLKINPEAALNTIISLTDFATERWMESHFEENDREKSFGLSIGENVKHFIGNEQVYHWYHGFTTSDIITSALMALEKWLYGCLDNSINIDDWIDIILSKSKSMAFIGLLSEIGRYEQSLFTGVLRPLILVPHTYYFELTFTFQSGHNVGTPASLREGEWFFNLARKWDRMEHRQYGLINIATNLFLNHEESRDALLAERENWANISTDGDERLHQYLPTLIATFDPDNWEETVLPDGSKGFAFEKPGTSKNTQNQLARSENQLLLLTLPVTCRKMLDEETPLEIGQILPFFERGKELFELKPNDEEAFELSPAANGVLGTIAVLFVLNRDWLRDNPDKEKWCINTLDQVLEDPPPWPEYDFPDSVGHHDWEHFACDISATLWADEPSCRACRERIARLALAKHYSAAGILMQRTFERRASLGERFWELSNLLLDWASARYEVSNTPPDGKEFDIANWANKAARLFIDGDYPADNFPWGATSLKNGKLWVPHDHYRPCESEEIQALIRIPRLEPLQIIKTFGSVFMPIQSENNEELQRFLWFWDQALVTCLAGTQFFDKNRNEMDPKSGETGKPYQLEKWTLARTAMVIFQLNPEDNPERFWIPILSLGTRAKNWVRPFLDHWFMDAKNSPDKKSFIREWKKMIEFCLATDTWKANNKRDVSNLWMCLIGLSQFTSSLWLDEDSPVVEEMGAYFAKAAPYILESPRNAVQFQSWLCELSAKKIRRQMLIPLSDTALTASGRWWKEPRLAKEIARYLGLLWTENRDVIEKDTNEKRVLMELLHKAAGTQDPLAMGIQAKIASHR